MRKLAIGKDVALVLLAFLFTRTAFFLAGIRFDTSSLGQFAQFLDPVLLRQELMQSLYYLHAQPPLFNLLLGIAIKLSPGDPARILGPIFLGVGLLLAISLHGLMKRLGVSRWIAISLTVLFVASPASVLYENWCFYTYPLALCLSLAAVVLHRFAERRRARDAVAFFTLLAVCVLTYSAFHLAWFLLHGAILVALFRADRRRVAAALCAPLLVVTALYVKNLVLFDTFTSSSWFGMSLARMTSNHLPEAERERLIGEGRLSPVSRIPPFSDVRYYKPLVKAPPPTGIPALDQRVRPSGWTNYNSSSYLALSRIYLHDARVALADRPDIYVRSIGTAFLIYLEPTTTYWFLRVNRSRISGWNLFYNRALYGELGSRRSPPELKELAIDEAAARWSEKPFFLVIGIPALLVFGCGLAWGTARRGIPLADPRVVTLAFVAGNALYVTVVGNALEIGENNRFRFVIDPLLIALLGVAAQRLSARLSRRRGAAAVDTEKALR